VADSFKFSLIGLDSLLGKFNAVTYDVKRKGGRAALRKGAMIVVNAAQEGWRNLDDPETGRSIADNVALRWNGRLFKRTGDLGFRIGIMQGAVTRKKGEPPIGDAAGDPTPHWRLKEFGTEKMPATPVMRDALENNIGAVTNEFLTQYEKSLDRAIKRARKKAVKV
jgi:HK97 gp10 family phage protein